MKLVLASAAIAMGLSIGTARADTADADALIGADWDSIVEMARGGEVNFFMWGGADSINRYVSDVIGGTLEAEYGITLNRIPLTDTADAVNLVLSEKEAGVTDAGAVDLIWINGVNFRTMKQGGLAWCGYTGTLPNNVLVNWDNPAIANDFGVPVEGCEVPWSRVQFAFAHDSALTQDPPRSIPELLDWIKANPGQFTYPAPPDFTGAAFVRHVFYHAAGGHEGLLGPFDQQVFDEAAEKTWAILEDIAPHLWREGRTYPASITQLEGMFANREVSLLFSYDPAIFGTGVENGQFPPTTRSYGLDDGTLANTNYTLIPFNSANKAAALVAQNVILSGMAQYRKALPDLWGAAPSIEVSRTSPEVQALFEGIERHPAVVPAQELAQASLPELEADWIAAIEAGWIDRFGQ